MFALYVSFVVHFWWRRKIMAQILQPDFQVGRWQQWCVMYYISLKIVQMSGTKFQLDTISSSQSPELQLSTYYCSTIGRQPKLPLKCSDSEILIEIKNMNGTIFTVFNWYVKSIIRVGGHWNFVYLGAKVSYDKFALIYVP